MMKDNEVRRMVANSPGEMMRAFIDSDIDDEENYIITGKVINNNDPEKQGKCQIRVFSVFDNVADNDLPWALPDFTFIGSKVGNFVVPPVGTIVNVYFDKGDIYHPHYTTKAVAKNSLPVQRNTDYPDNVVMWESDDGDYLTLNRRSKVTTFHHMSGTQIKVLRDGSVDIKVVANETKHVEKDETHTVKGTHIIQNEGIPLATKAKITIDPNGMITVDGQNVKIAHAIIGGKLEVTGSVVTPTGVGPLNAIPTDPVTGMPHSGNICF